MKANKPTAGPFRSSTTQRHAFVSGTGAIGFASEVRQEQYFKLEDLFEFKRGRADVLFSALILGFVLFLLLSFGQQSMWDHRAIPGQDQDADYSFADYMGYQVQNAAVMGAGAWKAFVSGEPLGTKARKKNDPKLQAIPRLDWPYEGRLPRFGKVILKSPWVIPLALTTLLVPAVIFNLLNSVKAAQRRARERRPNLTGYELSYWLKAVEYVAYFILYCLLVPVLGYLLSTLTLVTFLTWRLGYRSGKWLAVALVSAFVIVLVFRTGLQIKTPNSIWLYNQLPVDMRAFMLTYF